MKDGEFCCTCRHDALQQLASISHRHLAIKKSLTEDRAERFPLLQSYASLACGASKPKGSQKRFAHRLEANRNREQTIGMGIARIATF